MSGQTVSTFATVEHDLHRKRRAVNMPLFSKAVVNDSTAMVRGEMHKLLHKLSAASSDGSIVDFNHVSLALTTDVASQYLLHRSLGMQDDLDGKARRWKSAIHQIGKNTPLLKQFPWLAKPMNLVPSSVWERLSADVACLVRVQENIKADAKEFLKSCRAKTKPHIRESGKKATTIFQAIWHHLDGENKDKAILRLFEETTSVLIAGSETTARVLCRAMYELHANHDALVALRQELDNAQRELRQDIHKLTLPQLEHLPWLTGVIKETLRISAVLTSRLPLMPYEPIHYKEWTIPPMV
jgi:cytochrome P450